MQAGKILIVFLVGYIVSLQAVSLTERSNKALVDFCISNPCQNGGTCVNRQNSLSCTCLAGFTGTTCEVVDFCISNPCQNGGTCVNGQNSLSCTCLAGFTGTTCEVVDFCISNPCQNGGICVIGQNSLICTCLAGFTGTTCEVVDYCFPAPCKNGGTCVSGPNNFTCTCPKGFSGITCEDRSCRFEIDNEARCFFDINKSCWFRGKERVKAIAKAPKGAYGGDYFLYFDASCGKTGKKYRLYSGKGMKFEDKTYRLCLYYYIKGEGMKTFSIYTSRGETDNQKVFFVSGKRRNKWYKAQLDIHLDQETRIVFETYTGKSRRGNIVIDDVTLNPL